MIICLYIFTSCSIETNDKKKLGDVDFTVVPEENLSEELKQIIEERKGEEFKTTYIDNDDLYIVIGYGKQPTGGYSIRVSELYYTNNGVYIKTEFIGPSKSDEVTQNITYPYIVVKLAYVDKSVIFK
jgi:hypothetical protein